MISDVCQYFQTDGKSKIMVKSNDNGLAKNKNSSIVSIVEIE
ncbi:hypothetical protein EV201_1341 [Ancylomarina subtilis]|uniref:Uncharacterized protein n=1 Tax=Ancylomarina subtilis TaxID=1639035 RepID=A0A4Q7VKX5_9BACT|nr:hypothetical protein EV201_1341 [Ancylomarina subtilis]